MRERLSTGKFLHMKKSPAAADSIPCQLPGSGLRHRPLPATRGPMLPAGRIVRKIVLAVAESVGVNIQQIAPLLAEGAAGEGSCARRAC